MKKVALVVGDGSRLAAQLALMMQESVEQVFFAGKNIPEEIRNQKEIHVVPFVVGEDVRHTLGSVRDMLMVLPRITHFIHCVQSTMYDGGVMKLQCDEVLETLNQQLMAPLFFLQELKDQFPRFNEPGPNKVLDELLLVTSFMKHEDASRHPLDAIGQAGLRAAAYAAADHNRGFDAQRVLHVDVETNDILDARLSPSWMATRINEVRRADGKDWYRKAIRISTDPARVEEVKIHD